MQRENKSKEHQESRCFVKVSGVKRKGSQEKESGNGWRSEHVSSHANHLV
uniref:Uncharacterized protein n=1 Tax=Anguilla anguilla TaxID=7936 RepID=A0A0E9TJR5_ANGAN